MNILHNSTMRVVVFVVGILLIAFGVALTAKASLGNSPISAIPYSLSLYLPMLTFGTWVILFNLLLVTIECILLFRKISLLNIAIQIVLTFTFGGFIDASMFILQSFEPDTYVLKILAVVIGCFIIAAGAFVSCTQIFPYCRETVSLWRFPSSRGLISGGYASFPTLPCLPLHWLFACLRLAMPPECERALSYPRFS